MREREMERGMYLFNNNSIANTKGRIHRRRRYVTKVRESRPEKKNHQKSEESVKTRPAKETPTLSLTWHPSQGRISNQ